MNLTFTPLDNLTVPPGREIPGLQALKLLCAAMVVVIHTKACWYGWYFGLTRVAVPVFYMITGFFLVDAAGMLQTRRVKRAAIKIAWITLWAQLLYMAWYAVGALAAGEMPDRLWSPWEWLKMVFYGGNFGGHLWYLTSCLQALLIILLAVRCRVEKLLVWFIPVGIAMSLLLGSYSPLVGVESVHHVIFRGPLSTALPWIMAGVLLRRMRSWPDWPKLVWGIVALSVLVVIENSYIAPRRCDMLVSAVALAPALFMACVHFKASAVLVTAGSAYATGIYILHLAVMDICNRITPWADSELLAPATILLTLLLLMLWRRTPRRFMAGLQLSRSRRS